jgi:hypothetical protein
LIGDATGCDWEPATGDLLGTAPAPIDPRLRPLADNGGLTPTHALLRGSPALDAGSPDLPGSTEAACEPIDQRGVERPQDGDRDGIARCDIGAYELLPAAGTSTPDGLTPAGDDICTKWGFSGKINSLCNAYCEAMSSDWETRRSPPARMWMTTLCRTVSTTALRCPTPTRQTRTGTG